MEQKIKNSQKLTDIINNLKELIGGKQMVEKFEPKAPDYKGGSYAIWKDTDKEGNVFLRLKHDGWKNSIPLFKNEPKGEKVKEI